MRFHRACIYGLTLAIAGTAGAQIAEAPPAGARLYPNFGTYHRAITTDSPEAQQWFDQGLQLLYGFNHDEAIRCFKRAADLDPACAMAWWGVAYANGLHINNPEMSEKQSRAGWEAAQEAAQRLEHASAVERALIEAVGRRYAWPVPEDRAPLDVAYADAMQEAWRAHGRDPDVGALYAESLMNLQPWDLWTKQGEPKGRAEEIVLVLETVMTIEPDHPGANHFYIHAVEASPTPERALDAAKRLEDLVPGSGHLVHMPSHVYLRVGRYDDAADTNARAIAADRAYFAVAPEPEFYGLYIAHNFHFLAYAAMMEGRYGTAMTAARELEREVPAKFLENHVEFADAFMPTTLHVMIRFGRWEDILQEPEPPAYRLISRAVRHYARGVALSALGRAAEAREELIAFDGIAAQIDDSWLHGVNAAPEVLVVARAMLEGEILYSEGRIDDAVAMLRAGVDLEDELVYDEPPGWMQPVRHALGAILMATGRYAEAEAVYREDLARNPRNGWALLGLEQALSASPGDAPQEVEMLAAARKKVWRRADVQPTSSCYCAPGKPLR